MGKRKAEKDETVGVMIFSTIETEAPDLSLHEVWVEQPELNSCHFRHQIWLFPFCCVTGNRNVSSLAGLPKPWMTGWRRSSLWATSTGKDAQAVCTHNTSTNDCLPLIMLGALSTFIQSAISFWSSPALPKEYQRIGKAFQNLSTVFTSSGYQGTANTSALWIGSRYGCLD